MSSLLDTIPSDNPHTQLNKVIFVIIIMIFLWLLMLLCVVLLLLRNSKR